MDKEQVISIVKDYKKAISQKIDDAQVYLFGSYSKGTARPDSDIDVAVVVPSIGENWFTYTKSLWRDVDKVSLLIEPVLMEDAHPSPLYDDVMRTGVAV